MPILDSGLETFEYKTPGWSAIEKSNIELLDEKLVNVMTGAKILGQDECEDPDTQTSADLTDSSGGTVSLTIAGVSGSGADATINDNFASLTDQVKKLVADNEDLRDKIVELLGILRKTTGSGVLAG